MYSLYHCMYYKEKGQEYNNTSKLEYGESSCMRQQYLIMNKNKETNIKKETEKVVPTHLSTPS